ncbi:LysR family transcriptional regulator [Comamonas aquatica]|jgi:LysR family tcuABC transcriptional regulator|uniref:LysR family transcriptional regulator n=1 Tax=Comamonas aquatica TaxID=225991 RepID=A0A1B2D5R4_9BURK|nr:LysR family transcriptional regulator [Comamonas aquatica]ANY63037.1 LysR family transcriptional regulator [Comamonas aquatica]ANY63041.1 LysR family transcriptional regulator [Comamonas aquatica]MDH0362336.1 LysR family transcriptional regulator [Comamonas aquatica]MDH0382670.1 LysR family transcriptional regulator [Comamonas aquatica]MDH0430706.1 LysR family transcriptional regulator [Comamonas aquatica]
MELRQLRYFVRVVELGSMSRAAMDLDMVQSALSQQISRLESELSTRLLQRSSKGTVPTEAGLAFFHEAQLTLRHAEQAIHAAQQARLSGAVSIGLSPTIASVLGLPLMQALRQRYPEVRLHMVSALSGHLTSLLNARQLDLAILFDAQGARRWSVQPLLEEKLYLIQSKRRPVCPHTATTTMAQMGGVPLILPSGSHGLRNAIVTAFAHAGLPLNMALEIDGLPLLMEAVMAGMGATVQPWSAVKLHHATQGEFLWSEIVDGQVRRPAMLCGLSEDELSPAALAARVVLRDCAEHLVTSGAWAGATLSHHKN